MFPVEKRGRLKICHSKSNVICKDQVKSGFAITCLNSVCKWLPYFNDVKPEMYKKLNNQPWGSRDW